MIWLNKQILHNKKTIIFKEWIRSGILYLKHVVNKRFLSEEEILHKLQDKTNWIVQYKIIKKAVEEYLKTKNGIKAEQKFKIKNKYINPKDMLTKYYYTILINKEKRDDITRKRWCKEFNKTSLELNETWVKIYLNNINMINTRISLNNYKIIHNKIAIGSRVSKWIKHITEACCICGKYENIKHALYECEVVKRIWEKLSNIMKIRIDWKDIILGKYNENTKTSNTINEILGITKYAIIQINNKNKRENLKLNEIYIYKKIYIETKQIATIPKAKETLQLKLLRKIITKI